MTFSGRFASVTRILYACRTIALAPVVVMAMGMAMAMVGDVIRVAVVVTVVLVVAGGKGVLCCLLFVCHTLLA